MSKLDHGYCAPSLPRSGGFQVTPPKKKPNAVLENQSFHAFIFGRPKAHAA